MSSRSGVDMDAVDERYAEFIVHATRAAGTRRSDVVRVSPAAMDTRLSDTFRCYIVPRAAVSFLWIRDAPESGKLLHSMLTNVFAAQFGFFRFACVVDVRGCDAIGRQHAFHVLSHLVRHGPLTETQLVCAAFVVSDPLHRDLASLVFQMKDPVRPIKFFQGSADHVCDEGAAHDVCDFIREQMTSRAELEALEPAAEGARTGDGGASWLGRAFDFYGVPAALARLKPVLGDVHELTLHMPLGALFMTFAALCCSGLFEMRNAGRTL